MKSDSNSQPSPQNERATNAATLELTFAAAMWGFGFVGVVWALRYLGPFGVTGWRFALAFVVGSVVIAVLPGLRKQVNLREFKLAFWPGIFLAGTLVLQTWGLKYTTATKSGFLTTLYVLVVPLLDMFILKRKAPRFHLIYVALALLGVALICDLPQMMFNSFTVSPVDTGSVAVTSVEALARTRWNIGDWLTLACMLAASLQIFWFGVIQKKITSSFNFNVYQTFWAGLIPLPLALWLEPLPTSLPHGEPLIGILMISFGSTLIAFALQVRAQKVISPSLASLLYLLESPFAAIFAFILLGERFTTQGSLGAALILVALGSSVVFTKEKELVT